jgi:hypothetical protein
MMEGVREMVLAALFTVCFFLGAWKALCLMCRAARAVLNWAANQILGE